MATLRKELAVLDGDAGVRVVGTYGGSSCLVFVTRFGGTYTALVYSVGKGERRLPTERLASRTFTDLEEVVSFLKGIAGSGVEAYVY